MVTKTTTHRGRYAEKTMQSHVIALDTTGTIGVAVRDTYHLGLYAKKQNKYELVPAPAET